MTTCPECGQPLPETDQAPRSNARRDVTLTIPEEHLFIFDLLFSQMNVKFGMQGLGEFANLLKPYQKRLAIDFKIFRYFDEVNIAYLFLGIERGFRVTTRIEQGGTKDYQGNERVKVYAILSHPDEDAPREMRISEGAPEEQAREACAVIEDADARLARVP